MQFTRIKPRFVQFCVYLCVVWMSLCVYACLCAFLLAIFCNWRQQSLDFMISVLIFVWFWMSLCVYSCLCVFLLAFFAFGDNKAWILGFLCLSLCGFGCLCVCICLFVCLSFGLFLQLATTKLGFYDFCVYLCVVLDVFECVCGCLCVCLLAVFCKLCLDLSIHVFFFFVVLDVSVCKCLFVCFLLAIFLHLATTKPYTSNTVLSKLYLYLHCTSKGDVAQMLFLHYFDFAIVFMFTLSWCPYLVEAGLVVD